MSLRTRFLQVTLVVLSLAFGVQAQDKESCSNATLHGSYGFHAEQGSSRSVASSLMEMVVSPENSSLECLARILGLSNFLERIR
jgi:hypothetical protein